MKIEDLARACINFCEAERLQLNIIKEGVYVLRKKMLTLVAAGMVVLTAGCGNNINKPDTYGSDMSSSENNVSEKPDESSEEVVESPWIDDIDRIKYSLMQSESIGGKSKKKKCISELNGLKEDIEKGESDNGTIYCRLREIVSDIGISHVKLDVSEEYQGDNEVCELIGKWFGESYYITQAPEQYAQFLGGTITSINGYNMSDVLEQYDRIYSNETHGFLKMEFEKENSSGIFMRDLKYLGIIEEDAKEVTFTIFKDNEVNEVTVEPIKLDNSTGTISVFDDVFSVSDQLPFSEKVYEQHDKAPLIYVYDEDNRVVYLQYNYGAEKEREDEYEINDKQLNYDEFFDDMFAYMQENSESYDKFIIDFRYNTCETAECRYNFIEKYKDFLSGQDIRIIVGNSTYASAMSFIDVLLKEFEDIKIYGEETGISIHGYTDAVSKSLENTDSLFYIASGEYTYSTLAKIQEDVSKGLIPDNYICSRFEDYINGIDDVYNKAIE